MSTIVTRAGKGAPLSNTEMDANFTNLNSDKLQIGSGSTSSVANRVPYYNSSNLLAISTSFTFDGTTFTAPSASYSGNLTFTGTGNRITGDFSNATVANRVAFQTSTTNDATRIGLIPNGTSVTSQIAAYSNSDPTNASVGIFGNNNATVNIQSAITGTGTYLPLAMFTGGSERLRIDTSGNVGVGTASLSTKFTVNGGTNTSQIRWNVSNATYVEDVSTNAAQNAYVYKSTDALYHVWKNSSSEAMRIDSYGNVGIGTSSPNSKLTVVQGTQTYGFNIQANSSSEQGNLRFTNSGLTAEQALIGSLNGGGLVFNTGSSGAERMRIDSSGNVGVGTTSPNFGGNSVALAVNGATSSALNLKVADVGAFTASSGSGYTALADGRASTVMLFSLGGSERMRIDSSGNVGIGTSSPTAGGKLDVNGISYFGASDKVKIYSNNVLQNAGTLDIGTIGSAALILNTANTERMRIDSSGNVGIGTASPGAKLQVNGSFRNRTGTDQNVTTQSSVFVAGGVLFNAYNDAVSASTPLEFNASSLQFGTNNTERMRIDSSGNVLIGYSSQLSNERFAVYCNTNNSNAFFWQNYAVADKANISLLHKYTNGTTGTQLAFLNYNGVGVGSITSTSTATAYNTSSDYRLKENIAPMTGALESVAKLKPVTYTWKSNGSDGQGFIAHELQEVVPECVTGEKDATRIEQYEVTPAIPATFDEEGNELTPAVEAVMGEREIPVYQGIDTSFLVATLTAAIQEQQAMIEELKAKVAALEAK